MASYKVLYYSTPPNDNFSTRYYCDYIVLHYIINTKRGF